MQHRFLFCLFLICNFGIYAQTVTIIDEETNVPIELVTLTSGTKLYTTTNSEGQADVSKFKDAEIIEIRSLGYKTIVKSFHELTTDSFLLLLKPSNLNLDEVVISASKWRRSSDDVPAKVISISPREVAIQNTQTAADLLAISGKVFIQKSQQGGGSPMIRGFSTSRLLYSVDGVRMNTAIFRSGNLQNVISLDPFAIENTEVVFGPGSVVYGSDAVGGVMSFQTLTPQFSLTDSPLIRGKANTRYSSANNEKTGHFDVNVGFKKWSFLTSISAWDYDNLRQGSHGLDDYIKDYYVQRQNNVDVVITQEDELLQIPTAYSQLNMMQKIRFQPNEKWDFQFGFHYSETSPYGRYDRHQRVKNGTARYAEWDYGPQIWMMNNLGIGYNESNFIFDQMNIRLAHQWFEESRIDRGFNQPDRNISEEEVSAYSINADFIKATSNRNTVFYGLEYVLNDVKSVGEITDITTGITEAGPARYPKSTWQSIAAYVTDEFKMTDRFTLSAGARYNQILLDSEFDTTFYPFPFTEAKLNNGALTGSLGCVYRPSGSWVFSTNLGTAFRAPNVDDVGKVFDSAPGQVVVPNPDLKPEYAYNVDLGVAKVFGDVVKIDITGYYTHLKNSMLRRDYQLNGQDSIMFQGEMSKVQAIQNSAVANIYGVQFGLELKLPKGFGFHTDFNFQKGEEELENGETSRMRHAAPFFGTSRLNYRKDKLSMEFNVVFNGKKDFEDMPDGEKSKKEIYALDENGNIYSPAWYTLNFKSLYKLSKTIDVSGGIENLTDQRYRPFASGISGAGRNFILALTAHF
ncbi:TonB-dependent receptor [Aequorivita viscosa]|uniref:Hemoglobin/transferrin/lactoferrin receptor protein n=1 Tax=Aequorivita viscosa TaxID=797419 RepID=A0A1M6B3Z7_9FLAO|nr:TonB-dependent receptor [Aequorivita viscosa]SDW32970.1 hemoglobin/transferrin/lactoferrin receptor protein [Aequorivita viscosa]SHI43387.1 hemoglobin/transferrin/lactoferrin receptor protein [Aequorivita viscosa]